VLVHGAWADASSWAGEVRMLQREGVRVRAIANPVEDLITDARYVADFLKTVRGPIVLVGHSYGGAVITNAAAGVPRVKALVYVDAAAPAPGETNAQLSGSRSVLTTGKPEKLFETVPARRTHRAPTSCTCARPCSSNSSRATCRARRPSGSGRLSARHPPPRS
jgi:pimeloyl-ACP methyl ester carboxylesterase